MPIDCSRVLERADVRFDPAAIIFPHSTAPRIIHLKWLV
jgi:hypothetical protein